MSLMRNQIHPSKASVFLDLRFSITWKAVACFISPCGPSLCVCTLVATLHGLHLLAQVAHHSSTSPLFSCQNRHHFKSRPGDRGYRFIAVHSIWNLDHHPDCASRNHVCYACPKTLKFCQQCEYPYRERVACP
ncbi:unnamed protein product [Periconia digitata]|uniref:Uncharacterized protein n=1 Tax=Periconia digitata TaxID=1303443 RepID=A0A9W4U5C4_9PLEO|nr:unnamed protein product [Periconia digitata]